MNRGALRSSLLQLRGWFLLAVAAINVVAMLYTDGDDLLYLMLATFLTGLAVLSFWQRYDGAVFDVEQRRRQLEADLRGEQRDLENGILDAYWAAQAKGTEYAFADTARAILARRDDERVNRERFDRAARKARIDAARADGLLDDESR